MEVNIDKEVENGMVSYNRIKGTQLFDYVIKYNLTL